jgi:hypothetical protein
VVKALRRQRGRPQFDVLTTWASYNESNLASYPYKNVNVDAHFPASFFSGGIPDPDASYLDTLIEVLLR